MIEKPRDEALSNAKANGHATIATQQFSPFGLEKVDPPAKTRLGVSKGFSASDDQGRVFFEQEHHVRSIVSVIERF